VDKKIICAILVINVLTIISCATTSPDGYKIMTIPEFQRKVIDNPFDLGILDEYKLVSDIYIKNCRSRNDNTYIISLVDPKTGSDYSAIFNENIMDRFEPNILYKVYFTIPYDRYGWSPNYNLREMVIDKIDGLLSIEELRDIRIAEEKERIQREEIARQEQLVLRQEHLALVEEEFRSVIASRSPVTIMEYLRSRNLTSLPSADRSAIIQRGQLEVAKILTGNNNVKTNSFWNTWERYWGHSGRTTPFNAGAFEEGVVYTGPIIPNQFMDGLVYSQISDTPESSVLYRNVSAQDIKDNAERWLILGIQDALMVYEGQTQVRLTNGRTVRLPLFNVLYYRKQ